MTLICDWSRPATLAIPWIAFVLATGCATRSRLVEETMRVETQIERPRVIEAATTPSLVRDESGRMPQEIIHVAGDVRFAPGSTLLLPPSRERLDQLADWVARGNAGRSYYIEVQGHADATGDEERNLRLARARAEVVRHYLATRMSVPVDSIGVVSAGSLSPVATDGTAEGRARNRRAVVLVMR
jgi:outer membrane protein OmpA-like peptidoglycan-associated protein